MILFCSKLCVLPTVKNIDYFISYVWTHIGGIFQVRIEFHLSSGIGQFRYKALTFFRTKELNTIIFWFISSNVPSALD